MNICKNCNKSCKYIFCNRSCSATFNNKLRKHTQETKDKIKASLIKKYNYIDLKIEDKKIKKKIKRKLYKVKNKERNKKCEICNNDFYDNGRDAKRKTCSKECNTKSIFKNRSYQNGSRKTIKYINVLNKIVYLESSWELKIAILLDNLKIIWERPKPLKWFDEHLKEHLYYSDFYLPDYNIYLDPKNEYCIKKDKYKIEYFKNKITLIYGNVEYISNYIENMLK